jgi:hypothetical protein
MEPWQTGRFQMLCFLPTQTLDFLFRCLTWTILNSADRLSRRHTIHEEQQ